jgi:hypothetical protein
VFQDHKGKAVGYVTHAAIQRKAVHRVSGLSVMMVSHENFDSGSAAVIEAKHEWDTRTVGVVVGRNGADG